MKTTKLLILCAAALILSSCAGRQNLAQQDHQACESVGAYWGTKEYIQCRSMLYQSRQAAYQQRQARNVSLMNGIIANQQRQSQCNTIGSQTYCW